MLHESKGWSSLGTDIEMGNMESEVRRGFMQKVFGLLSLQLLLTVVISGFIIGVSPLKNWIFDNNWIVWVVMVASFAFLIGLSCVPDLRNRHPHNLILLFSFTACEGILIGVIAASYNINEVVMAALITLGVTAGLTLFALQTKWDFTILSGSLFAFLLVFLFASFFLLVLPANNTVFVVISAIGALLFSVYLVYDVQMIAGGGKHELGPDEYVAAALVVYLDIINIFLYILRLLGSRD